MSDQFLPHNLDAEKAVIGAVLVDHAAFERAANIIRAGDFFRQAHALIFETFAELIDEKRSVVDLVTVTTELGRRGVLDEVGGPAYVSSLTDGLPKSMNVQHYARLVKESSLLRQVIYTGNQMVVDAYDAEESAEAIITKADRAIIGLQRGAGPGRMVKLTDAIADFTADIEYRYAHKGELSGVDTGFPSINEITFGWQPADLIVGAARPSIGKTAFILNTVVAAARSGKHAAIFSLEMRRRQLEYRLLSNLGQINLTSLLSGYLADSDFERLGPATTEMHNLPISIDDRGGQNFWDIRSACRRMKAEEGLDLVVIDYVQLMPGTLDRRGATRNDEVTDISRRLKQLADEITCPIILLSQLNRGAKDRVDKRPRLEDLRESGALEQDADVVFFLHRKNHLASGPTQFIIEKARNGPGGTKRLLITRETQTFEDAGDEPEPVEAPPPPEGEAPPTRKRGKR